MMKYSPDRNLAVSVLIVTRNRSDLLASCLASLGVQDPHVNEIVLVDNDSTDDTGVVIRSFAGRLPIRHFRYGGKGFPCLYNFAIRKSTQPRVVFLDDDCRVDEDWSRRISAAVRKSPADIIQGKIISEPAGNIYAEIMGDHYANWIASHLNDRGFMDTFDNKNLIVPRKYLFEGKTLMGFSDRMALGSEDVELGRRLVASGITIRYEPAIIAYHRERSTFPAFVLQHLRMARSERIAYSVMRYEKVRLFPAEKTRLNIRSMARRCGIYARAGRIGSVFRTLFLYAVLFGVRMYGYVIKT